MSLSNIIKFYKDLYIEIRPWLKVVLGGFLAAIVIGFAAFISFPQFLPVIINYFRQLAGSDTELSFHLVFVIFKQNLTSSLMALLGGVVLGLAPVFIVMVNGLVLGYVVGFLFYKLPGTLLGKLVFIIVSLIPHGIFELYIILLSATLGLRLGLRWLRPQGIKSRWQVFKEDVLNALKFIPLLILVLLVAAFLEVFVSGWLISVLSRYILE